SRQGSDEDEHGTGRYALGLIGVRAKNRNLLQVGFAMHLGNAGMRPQLNVRSLLDLVNQILRHSAGERVPTNENYDALRVAGKIYRSLSGRIRAADHVHHL